MSRYRRTLTILALLVFLLSLWVQPLIAREKPFGSEDLGYFTPHSHEFGLGDDWDTDLITSGNNLPEIFRWLLISLYVQSLVR